MDGRLICTEEHLGPNSRGSCGTGGDSQAGGRGAVSDLCPLAFPSPSVCRCRWMEARPPTPKRGAKICFSRTARLQTIGPAGVASRVGKLGPTIEGRQADRLGSTEVRNAMGTGTASPRAGSQPSRVFPPTVKTELVNGAGAAASEWASRIGYRRGASASRRRRSLGGEGEKFGAMSIHA